MTLGRPDYLCFQLKMMVGVAFLNRPMTTFSWKHRQSGLPSVMAEPLIKRRRLNLPVQVLGLMQNINQMKQKKLTDCTSCYTSLQH